MSHEELFFVTVGFLAFLLLLLAIREWVILKRFPSGHKERVQGWFTLLMLVIASGCIVGIGFFIDGSRISFSRLLPAYPLARYAFEESDVFRHASWVFKTADTPAVVLSYYRAYAEREHVQFFEDNTDSESRMVFVLPTGTIFLTIRDGGVGGSTVLYFTRDGQMHISTN
jgi:hypothetical protein